MKYFNYLPLVRYNNHMMRNLMTRGQLEDKFKTYASVYYPYTQEEGISIEHIAHDYYDDVHANWMVYYANDIVDPFYGVTLSDNDFKAYVRQKYGSLQEARQQIAFYRNDWSADTSELTIAGYEALAASVKKYWNPIIGGGGNIQGYRRKREDYTYSTNKLEALSFTSAMSAAFTLGERITIDTSNYGTLVWANTTYIVLKHIVGDLSSNSNYTVSGSSSGFSATVNAETVTTLQTVIPALEQVYYSAVSSYDYEQELNEQKKHLNLVKNSFKGKMESELQRIYS